MVGGIKAEDWGAYSLVPASAPKMVLEAVEGGQSAGTIVSIARPSGQAQQKWIIKPKEGEFFTISPLHCPSLVLAVEKAGTTNGTKIVLEADGGLSSQMWQIKKLDNGSYNLVPKHAPQMGIDDLGGKLEPGAKIDLWANNPNDQHLQWFIKPLAGSGVAASTEPEMPGSGYVPPNVKPDDILPGEIKTFKFTASAIFPGTVRDVTVFIPKQYDGSKPACVYVKTDGYNPREKSIMETMIASKEMPVTVGVFVKPGSLPANVKGAMDRRNRCFEYDGVGDNNVRFIIEELLPFVAKEYGINLSTSGNDRCISGGSSGGITAFNCAWERPDAFSRVYCASGSFVAFRGGHEFPTLIRKTEAKLIRAFMTTATHDMENCAGDWFLIDQEVDKAMKFSGYDYVFRVIDGRHVAGYMENYQEAMAYLWKGWPEAVKAGPSAPRANDFLVQDEGWKVAAEGQTDARGGACNAKGEVFFADVAKNQLLRIGLDGVVKVFAADAGHANSLSVGADGMVYAVSKETGKVTRYDDAGKASPVVDDLRGEYVLAMPSGALLVTANGDKGGEIWSVQSGQKKLLDKGLSFVTGLAFRPDQWLLSVAEGRSKWAYSYQIDEDGSLKNKERFFWLHVRDWEDDAGAEAVCYSLEGQMFVGTRAGIQVCADDGPTQVILPMPDRSRVLGVCMGGKEMDTLFAFTGQKVWQRKLKVHAMGAFSPWTKVNATRL